MSEVIAELREFVVERLPDLIILIAILVVGWIIALAVSYMIRKALDRTSIDERIARKMVGDERATQINTGRWVGRAAYYIILLLTLLAFLQATRLTAASEPINAMLASVLAYIPRLFGAAAILFIAWVVASLTRALLARAFERWEIDRRLQRVPPEELEIEDMEETGMPEPRRIPAPPSQVCGAPTDSAMTSAPPARAPLPPKAPPPPARKPVSRAMAEAGYWLVLLLFLPAVLETLQLEGILAPVQEMLDRALGFLPNIISAVVILGVGWLAARVIQRVVSNVLAGLGVDRFAERIGVTRVLGRLTLSGLLGYIAYILVLIPVVIGALNALQLEAITLPASRMLATFLEAVPAIFGAALVLAVGYAAGRLLSSVVTRLLNGIGFDAILVKIGFARREIGERTPSDLVGGLVLIAVLYLTALEAARMLGFYAIVDLGEDFAILAGHILLGLVIFGVGLYLSKLAADAVRASDIDQARTLALVTRVAIVILTGGVALRQMGIANEIIELAFGLILGAAAVALALAFGLGGREAAARALEDMRRRMQGRRTPPPAGPGGGGGMGPGPVIMPTGDRSPNR